MQHCLAAVGLVQLPAERRIPGNRELRVVAASKNGFNAQS
jgi:hypothetical protein